MALGSPGPRCEPAVSWGAVSVNWAAADRDGSNVSSSPLVIGIGKMLSGGDQLYASFRILAVWPFFTPRDMVSKEVVNGPPQLGRRGTVPPLGVGVEGKVFGIGPPHRDNVQQKAKLERIWAIRAIAIRESNHNQILMLLEDRLN